MPCMNFVPCAVMKWPNWLPMFHHPKVFCDQHCEDCSYFQEMHGKRANVLVVTDDQVLSSALIAQADGARFNLEITDCEYNCSAIIDHFKPDFVIIDSNLGIRVSQQMSSHIMKDPRIPYVRVVIAGGKEAYPNECDRKEFARMTRPFDISNITECIYMNGTNPTLTTRRENKKNEGRSAA